MARSMIAWWPRLFGRRPLSEHRTWTKFGLYREPRFCTFDDLC